MHLWRRVHPTNVRPKQPHANVHRGENIVIASINIIKFMEMWHILICEIFKWTNVKWRHYLMLVLDKRRVKPFRLNVFDWNFYYRHKKRINNIERVRVCRRIVSLNEIFATLAKYKIIREKFCGLNDIKNVTYVHVEVWGIGIFSRNISWSLHNISP